MPREIDEENLEKTLDSAIDGVSDFTSGIFNPHVPPYDSTLDDCHKLG